MSLQSQAILAGVDAATTVHRMLRTEESAVERSSPYIDVFGAIDELAVPLYFAPLDNLLGACIREHGPAVGIVVTSRRRLHIQRFTAAHELGHFVLEHEGSLDREILTPWSSRKDPRETAADSFAAEFLIPNWLLTMVAQQHAWWDSSRLSDPGTVYQLSLRLGASYSATCWALGAHSILPVPTAAELSKVPPRKLKKELLPSGFEPPHGWADVWKITDRDHGRKIMASPEDILVLDLAESAAAGYLWEVDDSNVPVVRIVHDHSAIDFDRIGAATRRHLLLEISERSPDSRIALRHHRAFDKSDSLGSLSLIACTSGAHPEGEFRGSN
ncbi:ImmA/IrrE family metallo-endopeptidase [Enhygromyxa salina]|uniref:IrrE N-terminal-like domain-containing protein n=1 Tax=Enhygromyxa salina TaxID=215803 RepID=A0A2S9YAB0_9BACT|nr:ImmA/IrrE family metallo-endopeptidase [Enhygromyxa salina]PRQ02035.1 hypothetical protein ENSA7_56080 [Enhygromyxa salina]